MSDGVEFSVIVPTYRRPDRLLQCLAALEALDYPRDRFEVIVGVDEREGTSLPSGHEAVTRRLPLRIVEIDHAGPGAARNAAAASAAGTYLAFTDDDCAPAPDWLARLHEAFEKGGAAVGGRTVNGLPRNVFSDASHELMEHLYRYYNADPADARFFATNNFAVETAVFRRIGGFDESFRTAGGEDRELCDRLIAGGGRLLYEPRAVVHHSHPLTPARFWKMHHRYGRGAFHFRRARAGRKGERVRVEPPKFYADLVRSAFRNRSGGAAVAVAGLLVVAQAANALGFFTEAGQSRRGESAR